MMGFGRAAAPFNSRLSKEASRYHVLAALSVQPAE
jgi:hypothetical protein